MPKFRLDINVLQAAIDRIRFTFDEFEKVYVSFSAGKDSTVMLHLVIDEAKRRGIKVGVLLVDLEGQYKLTIEHAESLFKKYKEHIDLYWVCLPIHLRNAVSVYDYYSSNFDDDALSLSGDTEGINDPLSEKNLLLLRLDANNDRISVFWELFSNFFYLLFILLQAFLLFIELYITLWVFFMLIPKVLKMFLKSSGGGLLFNYVKGRARRKK